jgi:hypothetical protein
LAQKHFDTRFVKISVDNAPFLVTKLNVRVLPCVISFVDGISVGRIVGFEGLGTGDKFTTKDLESRLLQCGVLVREKMGDAEGFNLSRHSTSRKNKDDVDDDDDWD